MSRRRPSPKDPVGDQVERDSSEEYLLDKVLKPLVEGEEFNDSLLDLLTLEELVKLLSQSSSGRRWTPRDICRRIDAVFMTELAARQVGKQFISWREANLPAFEVFTRINSHDLDLPDGGRRCAHCWVRMAEPSVVGRRRLYCSDKCRQRAHRARTQVEDEG